MSVLAGFTALPRAGWGFWSRGQLFRAGGDGRSLEKQGGRQAGRSLRSQRWFSAGEVGAAGTGERRQGASHRRLHRPERSKGPVQALGTWGSERPSH